MMLCALAIAGCARTPARPAPSAPRPPRPEAPGAPAAAVYTDRTIVAGKAQARRVIAAGGQGAVAPADAGYFLDVLQGRLLQRAGAQFSVERRGERLVLTANASAGQAGPGPGLSAEGERALAAVAGVLSEFRSSLIVVRITDGAPARARQRAVAVARSLVVGGVERRRVLPLVGAGPGSTLEIQVEAVVGSN